MFKDYYVGERVFYSGNTSYGETVKRSLGTIISIGNSITILLDASREPYKGSDGCTNLPAKCYANIGIGDLRTGEKKIER